MKPVNPAPQKAAQAPLHIALCGSPNSGKTTLFNALTGLRARTGNYPGVTVARREGEARLGGRRIRVIDLPGTYGLQPLSEDEAIVPRVLRGEVPGAPRPDAIVITADACTLQRALPLVAQLLREGTPALLVVTMLDELQARGGALDCARLQGALGIPVCGVVGSRGIGLDALKQQLQNPAAWPRPPIPPPAAEDEQRAWAASVYAAALQRAPGRHRMTERVDRVVLHPLWGALLFALVMLLFFQLIFAWATPAMDFIDAAITQLAALSRSVLPPGLFADFIAEGVIAGCGAVIIFAPQIVLLFAMLQALDATGYMARAAFVADRLMGRVGLEGRAFVALLSSYACAVPGIMAARTLPSPKHRLVTILVAPLMTCSARLPVYALLIGAFVPAATVGPLGIGLQGLALFGLYLLGALGALFAAAVMNRWLLRTEPAPFYLELPPYRIPPPRLVAVQVWEALRAFLVRAGTIILCVSIVLWALLNFPRAEVPAEIAADARAAAAYKLEHSAAGQLGHALEPVIAPLGFDWKIGVGLVASLAAREVIVATLAQVYAIGGADAAEEETSLRAALRADVNPRSGRPTFTPATVASLLVFFVFALQCASTLAVMRRETNSWRWPAFAFGYLLALAYGASFVTYRLVGAWGG